METLTQPTIKEKRGWKGHYCISRTCVWERKYSVETYANVFYARAKMEAATVPLCAIRRQ